MNVVGLNGRVASFDEEKGLGWAEGGPGGRYRFHCTQIVDGSRGIAAGTAIRFDVRPGHLGRWEAHNIVPLTSLHEGPHTA